MKINMQVQNLQNTVQKGIGISEDKASSMSFGEYLNGALSEVNNLQLKSESLNQQLAMGLTDNIHEVAIASEKASLALQFTMEVRNKVMDAYQEIMRMPV